MKRTWLYERAKPVQIENFVPATPEDHILFGEKIDINKASFKYLTILPGIGPTLAGRIIKKRKEIGGFSSVNDLLNIMGIGRAKLNRIRQYIDAK